MGWDGKVPRTCPQPKPQDPHTCSPQPPVDINPTDDNDNDGGRLMYHMGQTCSTGMMDEMSLMMMPGRPKGAVSCNGLPQESHTRLDS